MTYQNRTQTRQLLRLAPSLLALDQRADDIDLVRLRAESRKVMRITNSVGRPMKQCHVCAGDKGATIVGEEFGKRPSWLHGYWRAGRIKARRRGVIPAATSAH